MNGYVIGSNLRETEFAEIVDALWQGSLMTEVHDVVQDIRRDSGWHGVVRVLSLKR